MDITNNMMTMEQQQLQILETYYPDRHISKCVYPSSFRSSRSQTQAGKEAECHVYRILSEIDEPMFVMHSKKFCVFKSGEMDFLIFSKERGIIILEVKSGRRSRDYNRAKQQLEKAQAAVKEKIKKTENVPVRYAVVMPNVSRQDDNPPHVEGCYREDLGSPEAFSEWLNMYMLPEDQRNLDNEKFDKCLVCFLSVILTGYDFNTIHSRLNSLTPEQAEILEGLDEEVYITGPAGSGKTACLVIKASSEELKEQRKLVVVFNKPLRDHLGKNHLLGVENIRVTTFHQLLYDIIGERKRQEVINNETHHAHLVKTAIQLLILSDPGYSQRFDSIFVDEAQDLFGNWEVLFDVLHTKGEGHYKWIFYDNNQKVRYSSPPTRNNQVYHLTKVIRNTKNIFEASKPFYSSRKTVKIAHRIEGPEVVNMRFTDHDIENMNPNVIQFILDAIFYLSKCLGVIRPGDICVLMESENRANMVGNKIQEQSNGKIVRFSLDRMVEFLQDGSWPGNEIGDRGNIGVTFGSVSCFKGQESKAVIFVIGALKTCQVLEKTYVGTTRAICHLTVLYSCHVEKFLKSQIENI